MRALLFIAVACAAAGCLPKTYHCASSTDCGTGVCEPTGFCAYTDPACTDGLRYGDLSGSLSQQCVGAQQGADGGVDAPVPDGSPATDTDGDGIPDSTDNCPTVANPMQENEDGDKFGDVCDPCPPVADDNPPDADGDGVADACDPRPNTPGDKIVLFEGFHHGTPPGWTATGTWTMAGDDIESNNAGGGAISALSVAQTATGHDTVSASLTVVANNGTNNFAGVEDDGNGGMSSVACSLANYIYNGTAYKQLLDTDGTMAGFAATNYGMTAGQTYQVSQRREMMMFACNATAPSGNATVMLTSAVNNAANIVGIYVAGADVRYHWFMVVSNP